MEYLDDVIRRFLAGVKDCGSVDCILVKLSTAFYSINDLARKFSLSVRELVNRFLSHPDVMKVLAGLASDLQRVEERIYCDARFSNLRLYQNEIIDAIKRASQIYSSQQIHEEKRHRVTPATKVDAHELMHEEEESHEEATPPRHHKKETRSKREKQRHEQRAIRTDIVVLSVLIVVFFVIPTILAITRWLSPHSSSPVAENSPSWTITSEMSWVRSTTPYRDTVTTVIGIEGASKSQQQVETASVSTTTSAENVAGATSTSVASKTTITTSTVSPLFIYTTKTTTIARQYLKPVLKIGKTQLAVEGGYLVVEYYGRWVPYLWIDVINRTLHLTPHVPDNQSIAVGASYIYISSNYTVAKYKLDEIAKLLERYNTTNIEITLKPESVVCNAILTENRTLLFSECESVILLTFPSIGGRSIFETVYYEVNTTAIDYLRNHLFNGTAFDNPLELSRFILEWLDKNAKYDYLKAEFSLLFGGVMGPVEFFEERSGVCADYAVFTATALLAGGSNEAYILIFNTTRGWHATAGIVVNGTLYVLDQHPPLYEWDEYTIHVFKPVGNKMQVMRIKLDNNGLSTIEIWTLSPEELESWLSKIQ